MPRLNGLGQACAGNQGNGVISVNGTPIGRGNGAGWLDNNEVGCQSAGPPYRLIGIDAASTHVRNLETEAIGANWMDFGNGQWQAALAGGPHTGVRGSNFPLIAAGGIGSTGRDGTQVVCADRQAGRNLLFPLSGIAITTQGLGQVQVISPTQLLWSGAGGGFHWLGLPFTDCPLAESWIAQPRAAQAPDGTWWLSYITQSRWLLQKMLPGPPRGHILQSSPGTFRPDLRILNGVLVAVASRNEGESPDSLLWRRIALTAPLESLSLSPPTPMPSAKATIESYQTPIRIDQVSRAIAKVTQGTPERFRWQWQGANGQWHTGADNPASDRDHSYNRANPPADNQFPGAGRYPIRLQTLVNGIVVDQSSSTSRVITVTASEPPEPPDPTPVPPDPSPQPPIGARRGIVHAATFCAIDDLGPWLPWGTSLFWQLYGLVHEPDRALAHRDYCRSQGADFVRVICTGLRKGSQERSLSPRDPRFQSAIADLLDRNWSVGLRTQLTVFGATYDAPTPDDRQRTIDLVCAACAGRESALWLLEIANEGWTNGFEGDAGARELKDLAARARGHLPHSLIATTCPAAADDVTAEGIRPYYLHSACSAQTHHYARKVASPNGIWRPTGKPWRESQFSVAGCPKFVQNNEPRGPESSGTETNDPRVLAIDAATSWLSGVGSYVLHTGAGIYGVADAIRARPADLWDTQNIGAIFASLRLMQTLLPNTLPNFSKHASNAASAPFHFEDVPEEQFALAYSASSGSHVGAVIVQPVCGVVRATTFTLRSGSCDGRVYHPVTGQVLEVFSTSFHVSPAQPAVLVVATRTA